MRRIISIIAVVMLVFSLIPQVSFASEGMVGISPQEVKADINALADVTVTTSVTDSVYLSSITNGTGTLIPNTDYKVEQDKVTISKYYLKYYFNKFPDQNIFLNFNFSDGTSRILTVYTGEKAHPEFDQTSGSFNCMIPGDVKFSLKLNGSFITSIKTGMESLVQRIDYTYSIDTKELIIRKGYLYGKFRGLMSPLTLLVTFTGGIQENIEVKPVTGGFKAIAAGGKHTVAVKEDETVAAWGNNEYGQCDVPEGLTGVKAIAAGQAHTVALKEDGTIVAWGVNVYGECDVPNGITAVKAIAACRDHTVALKEDGTVLAWGYGDYGQCDVPEGLTGVKAISTGDFHTVALKEDGTIVVWGMWNYGVPSDLGRVKGISAGQNYTVALKEDGTVVVWGDNSYGQCNVPKGLAGVRSIAAFDNHILALKEDGTVVAWGNNSSGQCNIPNGLTGVKAITVGGEHTSVLMENGTVTSWGDNSCGQCSSQNVTLSPSKVGADLNSTDGVSVSAISKSGANLCSITNGSGTLKPDTDFSVSGNVITISKSYLSQYFARFPNQNIHLNLNFSDGNNTILTIYAGTSDQPEFGNTHGVYHLNKPDDVRFPLNPNGCFITSILDTHMGTILNMSSDYTYSNDTKELIIRKSYFQKRFAEYLEPPVELEVRFTGGNVKSVFVNYDDVYKAVAVAWAHVVAVKQDGTVRAWGAANSENACRVPAGLKGVKDIKAAELYTIALKEDGTVAAWGYGGGSVPEGLTGVKAIATGGYNGVALKQDGTVVEWGSLRSVPEGLKGVKAIAVGYTHTVALKEDGTVVVWGDNSYSQCNVPAGLKGVKAIAAANDYTLALKEDGTVIAWGFNSVGQCNVPQGLTGVKAIAAGRNQAAALKEDGTVVVWGSNDSGQCNVPAGLKDVKAITAGSTGIVALKEDGTLVPWGYTGGWQCITP